MRALSSAYGEIDRLRERRGDCGKEVNTEIEARKKMGDGASLFYLRIFFLCSGFPLLSFSHSVPTPINLHGLKLVSFDEGLYQLFGDSNLILLRDGIRPYTPLDERTGAGFASVDLFLCGFFCASIKAPIRLRRRCRRRLLCAFLSSDFKLHPSLLFQLFQDLCFERMSNGDVFEKNHDESGFPKFLGNIRGREWSLQATIYGNEAPALEGRDTALWSIPLRISTITPSCDH
ncbi:hypothetical protein HPP92_016107 [Vanilla planifolia]|uniref:Uncharacterized protein n=1 Tax=Vanilla planifolia TaxID=51239 RepID=A0A835QE62_VANPL|nr:hypothetical protein HPP92_016107 [Vanilla planifolia]